MEILEEEHCWLDTDSGSRQRDLLSWWKWMNWQSEFGERPGVRARVQVDQCASDTSTFPTPGTGAEVIDSPAILSDISQTERRQHLGLFQMLQQNKLNLIRINHTQPRAICKYQGKYSRKSAWNIVALNKGGKLKSLQWALTTCLAHAAFYYYFLTKKTDVDIWMCNSEATIFMHTVFCMWAMMDCMN